MPGANEMRIAVAASAVAAFSREIALARLSEIEKLLVGIQIEDDGADRNFEHHIVGGLAGAIRAFAVAAANGFEFAIVAVAEERVVVRIGFDVNVAALAAVAGFDGDFCFIRKHGSPDLESLEESIRQGWEQRQKYAPWKPSAYRKTNR